MDQREVLTEVWTAIFVDLLSRERAATDIATAGAAQTERIDRQDQPQEDEPCVRG